MQSIKLPSPIHELLLPDLNSRIFIKREDLIHDGFGGNKWRKLKYNLEEYSKGNYNVMLSFGGAFSNHIHALAQACAHYGIPSVGIIRGEYDPLNPTLISARKAGMKLHFVSRLAYREKENHPEIKEIIDRYNKVYLLPEGGSNELAKKGVIEMVQECNDDFDYIFLAAGTGMTATGVIEAVPSTTKVIVVNALKNLSLDEQIESQLLNSDKEWEVTHKYHFGGYAKVPDSLLEWNRTFYKQYGLLLDPVYNVKAIYGLLDWMGKGKIPKGSSVLYINTGGIQGIKAYEYLSKKNWTKS